MICKECNNLKLESDFYKNYRVCKTCNSSKRKQYYLNNKEQIALTNLNYYIKNKAEISEYKRIWQSNKLKNSIEHRLKNNLRTRLNHALKRNQKFGSAINDLGCSIEFFKQYLEQQFVEGMNWDNYGNREGQWSIDHIIALSTIDLTDREQLLKVCHYTNLRPMWQCGVGGNISKGNR